MSVEEFWSRNKAYNDNFSYYKNIFVQWSPFFYILIKSMGLYIEY